MIHAFGKLVTILVLCIKEISKDMSVPRLSITFACIYCEHSKDCKTSR